MAVKKSPKPIVKKRTQSGLRFTPAQAEMEDRWAMELYETRKRFCDQVSLAMQTRSPTRRKQLYEDWRREYGDALTRGWAVYAESIYAGGDNKLVEIFRGMTQELPSRIPDYMILPE